MSNEHVLRRFKEVHGYDPRVPMSVRTVMRSVISDPAIDKWWFESRIQPEDKTPAELYETMSAKQFIGLLDGYLSPSYG